MKHLLTGGLMTLAGVASADIANLSDAERETFRSEVRAYLMENPEVIIEAVNALEERRAQEQAQNDVALVSDNMDAIVNDGFSWVGGNPDGDITLVEFMDYRCGYCRRAVDEVETLLSEDGNIRFVIKELPILGEASLVSSRFAIATKQVAGDEAYKQIHDALMQMTAEPNETQLRRLAETFGLDADAIVAKMGSSDVTQVIAETRQLAQRLGIQGTPAFVLGDELLRGYLEADQMQQIVAQERS